MDLLTLYSTLRTEAMDLLNFGPSVEQWRSVVQPLLRPTTPP